MDQHAALVYAMERLEFGGHWKHELHDRVATKWVRQACKNLQVERPKIVRRTVRGVRGYYDPDVSTIVLDRKFGRSGLVLLHELAHHVTYVKHPKAADHGPRWMLIYAILLDMTRLVPMAGTRAACRRHGVRIAKRFA